MALGCHVGAGYVRVVAHRAQETTVIPRHVTRLAYLVALANGAAAALTLLIPDVLTGPALSNGNARGTTLVMLVIAIPLLVVAATLAQRDAPRAALVLLGALAYLAYNDVLLLFLTPFNRLFLLYTSAFAATIFTSIETVRTLDFPRVAAAFVAIPSRAIAGYAWVVVVLNTLGWLATIVPAMTAERPGSFLDGVGVATNAVFAEDLSFWLPGAAIAAALLWRRRPAGFVLIGAWLVYGLIESISVATDQWFGMQADPSVDATPAIVLFVVLAVIGLVPLSFYFRDRRSRVARSVTATAA
jgi:hypothetical protein